MDAFGSSRLEAMQDFHAAVLARAWRLISGNYGLTSDDRRHISALVDDEVVSLVASGHTDIEDIAARAVKAATKRRRRSQGVASRASFRREALRRTLKNSARAG